MIMEVAILDVVAGKESEFEDAFGEAQHIIAEMEGYISHQLQQCLEKSNRYILLVQWRSLKDHTEGFRKSAGYQKWKALLHGFYDPFPQVEHYRCLFSSL